MVLMPPLSGKMHGHYCTAKVAVAFALFATTILLQLSFTIIAGLDIFRVQHAWMETFGKRTG